VSKQRSTTPGLPAFAAETQRDVAPIARPDALPSAGFSQALGPFGGDVPRLPPPPHHVAPTASAPIAPAAHRQPSPEPGEPAAFGDSTDLIVAARRRTNRIVLAAGGAAVLLIIVIVVATGGGKKGDVPATASGSAAIATPSVDAPTTTAATTTAPPAPADAAPAPAITTSNPPPEATTTTAVAPPVAPTGDCRASFASTPPGADVVLDGKALGVTPLELALPCHAATATFKRTRYQNKDVAFTPTSDGAKVSAHLERPSFTVKITSTPPGATVTIAGKVAGKTPLNTRAPGFEPMTVAFKKDGFAPTTARLYAKANSTVVTAKLKKAGAPAPKTPPKPAPRRK